MTLEQFLIILDDAPWKLPYISNVFSYKWVSANAIGTNYISSVFDWSLTPEGTKYWATIKDDISDARSEFNIETFKQVLYDRYSESNPEYFI